MWATAHIRRKFFAGFKITSRCEGLHSEFSDTRATFHGNDIPTTFEEPEDDARRTPTSFGDPHDRVY